MRKFAAALLLVCVLGIPVMAGDVGTPPEPPPSGSSLTTVVLIVLSFIG